MKDTEQTTKKPMPRAFHTEYETAGFSQHFSYREMTISAAAIDAGLPNDPPAACQERLHLLCVNVLEPLRRRFGAIRVTSGYRSPAVNRAVGGAPTSQHCLGEAADLYCHSLDYARELYTHIRAHLPFDQLILERPARRDRGLWIHVSYTRRHPLRRQALGEIRN